MKWLIFTLGFMHSVSSVTYHPLIRICVSYMTGIGISQFYSGKTIYYLVVCGVLILNIICLAALWHKPSVRSISQGLLIHMTFVVAGTINYQFAIGHNNIPDVQMGFRGIILSAPLAKDRTIQLDCRIVSFSDNERNIDLKEKVRLYLEPDSTKTIGGIGDSIEFCGRLNEIRNPGNPVEFDYARYMGNLGIRYSGYIKNADYCFGNYSGRLTIRRFSSRLQQQLISRFIRYGIRNKELAVLSALTAGNRDYLEQELNENYIAVGAMHILSVSGLHVGILYLILISVFRNWSLNMYYRMFRIIIILSVIWLYAFITGLTSSVLRASVMFSLFLIGKNLHMQTDSYNTISASALLILLINPLELFKVGFQFSYLAVLGILYFQPKLEQLILPRNNLIDKIWQLLTVSLAAQLTTFHLSLYYFHQFPVYFWFANIIIIPLVWLIMVGAVIFCFLIPLAFLLPYLAFVLNLLLKILNHSVEIISTFPFATITDIRFETFELLACSLVIVLLMYQISVKHYKLIPFLVGSLIAIIILEDTVSFFLTSSRKEFIVYSTRSDALIISLMDGNNHTIITEGIRSVDDDVAVKYLRNFWISRNSNRKLHWIPVDKETPGKQIQGQNLKIKMEPFGFSGSFYTIEFVHNTNPPSGLQTDSDKYLGKILIIDDDSGYPDRYMTENSSPELILAVNKMSPHRKEKWKLFAQSHGITFYDLSIEGAYHKRIPSGYDKHARTLKSGIPD